MTLFIPIQFLMTTVEQHWWDEVDGVWCVPLFSLLSFEDVTFSSASRNDYFFRRILPVRPGQ